MPEDDLDERYTLLLAREGGVRVQGEREAQRQDLAALEHWRRPWMTIGGRAKVARRKAQYAIPDRGLSGSHRGRPGGGALAQAARDVETRGTRPICSGASLFAG